MRAMRQIRKLLIITSAVVASNCASSADRNFEAVCSKYFNPGFFQNLFETLEPNKSGREFEWCINERSRSTTIEVDSIYGNRKMDDSEYRESRGKITEATAVRMWKNSTSQNNGSLTDDSMSLFTIKGRLAEGSKTKEELNTLKGFKTISE